MVASTYQPQNKTYQISTTVIDPIQYPHPSLVVAPPLAVVVGYSKGHQSFTLAGEQILKLGAAQEVTIPADLGALKLPPDRHRNATTPLETATCIASQTTIHFLMFLQHKETFSSYPFPAEGLHLKLRNGLIHSIKLVQGCLVHHHQAGQLKHHQEEGDRQACNSNPSINKDPWIWWILDIQVLHR